ncbi:unnamed protein product [Calypogeia fissa]
MFAAIAEYSGWMFAASDGGRSACRRNGTMGLGSYNLRSQLETERKCHPLTQLDNNNNSSRPPLQINAGQRATERASQPATHESEDPETLKFYRVLFRNIP